jgi:hypothetical protein
MSNTVDVRSAARRPFVILGVLLVLCNANSFESNPSKPPYPPSPLIRGSLREGRLNCFPPEKGGLRGVGFKCYMLRGTCIVLLPAIKKEEL